MLSKNLLPCRAGCGLEAAAECRQAKETRMARNVHQRIRPPCRIHGKIAEGGDSTIGEDSSSDKLGPPSVNSVVTCMHATRLSLKVAPVGGHGLHDNDGGSPKVQRPFPATSQAAFRPLGETHTAWAAAAAVDVAVIATVAFGYTLHLPGCTG